MGYLCANFSLPRPLCSRLRPDVRDRQTDVRQTDRQKSDAHHRLMPPTPGAGHNKYQQTEPLSLTMLQCFGTAELRRRGTKIN